jgi:hypothetical protein
MAEKIKVKQSTIDAIKKAGMTKALASAKTNRNPEYQEALRRMYGERRLKEAMKGAQGGSQPKETYMYRGTPGTKKKTSAGPKMGGGQGYKGSTKSQQQAKNRKVAGAAAGAGGVAGLVALGAKQAKNTKAGVAQAQKVIKKSGGYKLTKAAQASRAAVGAARFPQAAVRGAGPVGTALTVASLAALGAQKAKREADAAGRKVKAAGSGRTSAMAASIKKNRKKK